MSEVLGAQEFEAPAAPPHLTGVALERWRTIWEEVDPTRVTARHADSVALYCQAFGTFYSASEMVNRLGAVVLKDKRAQVSPYLAIRDNSMRTMMELSKALGLSPDVVQAPLSRWDEYAGVILEESDEDDERRDRPPEVLDGGEGRAGADSGPRLVCRDGSAIGSDIRSPVQPLESLQHSQPVAPSSQDTGDLHGGGAGHLRDAGDDAGGAGRPEGSALPPDD